MLTASGVHIGLSLTLKYLTELAPGRFEYRRRVPESAQAVAGRKEFKRVRAAYAAPLAPWSALTPRGWARGHRQRAMSAIRPRAMASADERAMRPIVIGRKNWLFAGNDARGETLARRPAS